METLQRTANRGSISTGYDIDNSLKLEGANGERLYFTPASAGNRKTWTVSLWFKRTDDGYSMMFGTADTYVYLDTSGGGMHIRLDQSGLSGSTYLYTTAKYRDTSAWYHFVMAVDTTQATASNRAKFYVNGVQVTDFTTEVYPTQNIDTDWNFTNAHYVGGWTGAAYDSSGYMAEVHSVDGQQLAPTDFGEFDDDTGIWKPIEYTGTYGTNGFYLEFKNAADLGDDTSGNNKNFVLSNITSVDQATDTPTNNFCIINPNFKYPSSQEITEGNTEITRTSGTGHNKVFFATIPVGNGKWYAEFEPQVTNGMYGVCTQERPSITVPDNSYVGQETGDVSYYYSDGNKYVSGTSTSYGNSYAAGDVMGIALDMDNRYVYFAKNGTWQNSGDPTSGSSGTGGIALPDTEANYMMAISYSTGGNWYANWGGYTLISIASGNADGGGYGNFEYAPPSGYYALCTKNLAEYG